jgi:hypothetical protein
MEYFDLIGRALNIANKVLLDRSELNIVVLNGIADNLEGWEEIDDNSDKGKLRRLLKIWDMLSLISSNFRKSDCPVNQVKVRVIDWLRNEIREAMVVLAQGEREVARRPSNGLGASVGTS